jgi:hypothetical protein
MFIVREPERNLPGPRRGGMGWWGAGDAAPPGLGQVNGGGGGYNQVAPPELWVWRRSRGQFATGQRVSERPTASISGESQTPRTPEL